VLVLSARVLVYAQRTMDCGQSAKLRTVLLPRSVDISFVLPLELCIFSVSYFGFLLVLLSETLNESQLPENALSSDKKNDDIEKRTHHFRQ
jgi:hypothetical protein